MKPRGNEEMKEKVGHIKQWSREGILGSRIPKFKIHEDEEMKAKWRNEEGKSGPSRGEVAKAQLDPKFQDLYRLQRESFDRPSPPEYLSYFQRQRFSQISEPVWWLPVFLRWSALLQSWQNKSHRGKPLKDASNRISGFFVRVVITQLGEQACKML